MRNSGHRCDLALTLCKYDLRKGDLFILGWARVRRVRLGSIYSEQLMPGGDVRSIWSLIFLIHIDNYIYIYIYIYGACLFLCRVGIVWGSVRMVGV